MTTALVYQDYTHNNGVLIKRLQDTVDVTSICFIDADDINNGILEKHPRAAFFMPGGADLFFCEKLNGSGNKKIQDFVKNGGLYIGICAGAYYACRTIKWAEREGDAHAICEERELSFITATATGPVYDFIENGDYNKSWASLTTLSYRDKSFPAYYEGGPIFEDIGNETNIDAWYTTSKTERQPAIISQAYGNGYVILASPHIEYTPDYMNISVHQHCNSHYNRLHGIIQSYKNTWSHDCDLWSAIISPALRKQRV